MFISRTISPDIIKVIKENRKIVVLYGARQTGKTTLIFNLLKHVSAKKLIINADEQKYIDILSSRDLNKLQLLIEGYDLLFIDEAQRIPDIGINLKILHDRIPELKIIATGSSSFELANKVREPLTGRTKTFHLYPISFDELRAINSPLELQQRLDEFLIFGMYPEIFSILNQKEKSDYLRELTTSYLYKDVFELTAIKHTNKMKNLLRLLAFQIGSQVSLSELGQQLHMSKDTVSSYIDLLEKAFVIYRLSGFNSNLRKEISKMDKIYFWDVGVRNAVINNFNMPDYRDDMGRLWENFIISERLKFVSNRQKYVNFYFWRTYTGAELDYVEEAAGQLSAYEIKWKKVKNKIPPSWKKAYPDAAFSYINSDNFFDFISLPAI
jgi:predicted AAA+ superfamily ATPase